MRRSILMLTFALAFTAESFAQAQSGTIVGTLTDQAGGVIPGANVKLVNTETQFTRTAVTNASGQYVAYSVPTGTYTITVEQAGFQKLVRNGVRLTAADTVTIDLQLTLGSLEQTVQITAETPLLAPHFWARAAIDATSDFEEKSSQMVRVTPACWGRACTVPRLSAGMASRMAAEMIARMRFTCYSSVSYW